MVAFSIAFNQNHDLLGKNGLLPANKYMEKLKFKEGIELHEINTKNKYTYNKKMAINCTLYKIRNNDELLKFFNKHKKKDDLSDSYLQGISFIEMNLNPSATKTTRSS